MTRDSNYKIKLRDLIAGSRLPQEQKDLWDLFLKASEPAEDEAVYEAACEDEASLKLLTMHLRDKIRDMNERSKGLWQKLAWS